MRRYLVIVGWLVVLFLPYLLILRAFQNDYNVGSITGHEFNPVNSFQPLGHYLHEEITWLAPAYGAMSLQVGYPAAALALGWLVTGARADRGIRPLILITLGCYLFLLTSWSAPIYDGVRPLQFIQFSFRLMTFVTPLALLAGALFLDRITNRRPLAGLTALAAVVAAALLSSPAMATRPGTATGPFMPKAELEPNFAETNGHYDHTQLLGSVGEYLPARFDTAGQPIDSRITKDHYIKLRTQPDPADPGCTVTSLPTVFEATTREFDITCATPREIVLPLNYSRLHRAYLKADGLRHRLVLTRTPQDGRIHTRIPAGHSGITVDLPSLNTLLKAQIE